MNLGGVFYTPQSFKLHDIQSSFTNSYLLKHGNIFGSANIKGFPINLKTEGPDKKVKNEPTGNDDHPDSHAGSPSPEKCPTAPEDTQNAAAGGGKCDTWVLGTQKLSWDNSTVASYNPETKMFRCVVCNAVGFLSRIAEHYLGTHTSAKVFQCLHCPYSSTWSRCVRMHMAKHHGVPNAPPSLWKGQPLLEEIFHLLNTLKTTVDGQGKEKADVADKKFACPKCPYTTDRRDLFLRHENIHNEEKPYHCYVCYRLFNRADHVKKHFLRIHRDYQYDISLVRRNPSKLPPSQNSWPSHSISHSIDNQAVLANRIYSQDLSSKEDGCKELPDKSNCPNTNLECPVRTPQSCYVPKYNSNYPCSTCEYIRAKAELLLSNVYTFRQRLACAKCKFIGSNPVEFEDHIKTCCSEASKHCEETGTQQRIVDSHTHGDQVFKKKGKDASQAASDDCVDIPKTNIRGSIQIIPLHNSMSFCYSPHNSDPHAANRFPSFKAHIPDVQSLEEPTDSTAQETKEAADFVPSSHCRNKDEHTDDKPNVQSPVDIVCWYCGCEFADQSSLQTHEELYHRTRFSNSHAVFDTVNKKKKNFVCVVCHFCSTTQRDMMEHMRCHTGQLLKCHAGKPCSFTAVYDSDLSNHVLVEHNDGITRCPHCGLSCLITTALVRHYELAHHPFPCDLCKQIQHRMNTESSSFSYSHFKRQANLHNAQVPQSTFSQGSPIFRESLPAERSKRSRKQTTPRKVLNLKKIPTDSTKKIFCKPDDVNSDFLRNRYRKKLIKSHTLASFCCRMCCDRTVMYREKKNFVLHRFWAHSRKNVQCPMCEEKFRLRYQMRIHVRKQHLTKLRQF